MSEELLRLMMGREEPSPDDGVAVYLDRESLTAGYMLTRWWIPGKAIPLLFAIAQRKPTTEHGVPPEALHSLAENLHVWLLKARAEYGWSWRGNEDDPLFRFIVELAMTFWPSEDCNLDWVSDELLESAQVNADAIVEKWRLASSL